MSLTRLYSRCDGGFSLIELLVSIALGLLLLSGLTVVFVSSSRNLAETERASRQIENGRYALDVLSREIRHAGFYGETFALGTAPAGTPPDPCSATLAVLQSALPVAIQGIDFIPGNADPSGKVPSCVPDHVPGTDILIVRRAKTTPIPASSAVANGYYTQVSFCSDETTSFQLARSGFTLKQSDCVTPSPIRQFLTNIYYVSPCRGGSGSGGACTTADGALPTLKRMELGPSGWSVAAVVEGIEDLQLEYGLDTDPRLDGNANVYTASPAATGTAWASAMAVRIHLLARNTDATPGFIDTKTYRLGQNADGTDNTLTPGGAFKRHLFTGVIRVVNMSQRLEPVYGPT
jgi:type IV pilus assembly protein PilW